MKDAQPSDGHKVLRRHLNCHPESIKIKDY